MRDRKILIVLLVGGLISCEREPVTSPAPAAADRPPRSPVAATSQSASFPASADVAARIPESSQPATQPANGDPGDADAAALVLRQFLTAAAKEDEAAVRRLALPAEGIETLARRSPDVKSLPTDEQAEFRARLVDELSQTKIRALHPGEVFELPHGHEFTIPDQPGERWFAINLREGPMPTPFRMVRDGNTWRFDARALIAARRAAERVRAAHRSDTEPATQPR